MSGHGRRRRLRRVVSAQHWPRGRVADPRRPVRDAGLGRRAAAGGRRDRRAWPLSCRVWRLPHRGPRRGHRFRLPDSHSFPQGHPMPAITTNDLKTGITLELDNGLFQVVEFQHVKPGKGGAFVRTRLRNVRTGNVFDRTFNAGVRVEQAIINREEMQFLYRDGDDYVFMNNDTYEQMHVAPVALGDAADYMVEGMSAQVAFFQGDIISVEIPAAVELKIAQTEPGVQGDRVSGARKPARLETGKLVQVPLFVETGDRIKVDTRSGE